MESQNLEHDLALTHVYSSLDRSGLSMEPLARDFIYALIRLAYVTGRADGIQTLASELRKNGHEI
jgi:hypothetical protein